MEKSPQTLTDLPNIGPNLAEKLIEAGITTPAQLFEAGAENAFIRLYTIDNTACLSKLCAIEGAIQGIRWHNLSPQRKDELKSFFNSIKKC